MNKPSVPLKEVDRIEILTVIDNYVDVLLTNTEVITRPPLSKSGTIPVDTLLAEHGLSLLVTVYVRRRKAYHAFRYRIHQGRGTT